MVTNRRELRSYVWIGTATVSATALSADIANQLIFFAGWDVAFRSWAITITIASVIASTMFSVVGRANLALYHTKRELETLSRTDPLTGLLNRRGIFDEVQKKKFGIFILVIFDLDHFKKINDRFGHHAGDTVLQVVSRIMADELEPLGIVGRLGGEEFALVARATSLVSVLAALHRLRERLAATPVRADGNAVSVTISAGAAIQGNDEELASVYTRADQALYEAKTAGRNRICLSAELEALLTGAPRTVQ